MSFYKKYITLNLNEYEAFEGIDLYVTLFLAAIAAALCVGIFVSSFRKNAMINIIRQLYRHGATSEASAKTLLELGIKNTSLLRGLLSSGRLARAVVKVGEVKKTYEEYIAEEREKKKSKHKKRIADKELSSEQSFDSYRFYISRDTDMAAKSIISKSPTSVWQCILLSVFVVCICVCLLFIMPELLESLSSFLTK